MFNPFDDRALRLKTKVAITYSLLISGNVAAWIWAWTAFADKPALLGMAFLAYMLGLRHAFDADHIAAIDNVVRKLMQANKAPFSTGFFFSLGHSTIVVLASVAIAATTAAMEGKLRAFHEIGGVLGTAISALFLLIIGFANLFILNGIWSAFRRARRGEKIVDEDLDALLTGRGLIARIFRPLFNVVSKSWHMYPLGFLFGLGFDTATEVGLLGISAAQAAQGMSFWTILVFPALFTAGMTLMDTTDSVMMTGAYGWALLNPIRKLWYNLTITTASVVVAIFVGGLEGLGLMASKLDLDGAFWRVIRESSDSLANYGYAIVGILVVCWIGSTVVYRVKGYDRLQSPRS